jgi:serine/threonine protein kinase
MSAKRYPDDAVRAAFPEVRIVQFLDAGSYKSVYIVATATDRGEVLKIISLPQDQSTDEKKAFRQQELGRVVRETSILAGCSSPFLVRLGSIAPCIREVAGESCYAYTEEQLAGASLKAVIDRGGAKPGETEIKLLLRCLMLAIQSLWAEQKAVHRDIKPANVFSTGWPDRPYVLLDLGIAFKVTEPGLTVRPDHIPHTPLYLAPEMIDTNFRESLSYRADFYAAGITAFEFATGGIHPLAKSGENLGKTYYRILTQEPTLLATLRPDLPPPLCLLIDQLLKKKPALRPGNFALILSQLT